MSDKPKDRTTTICITVGVVAISAALTAMVWLLCDHDLRETEMNTKAGNVFVGRGWMHAAAAGAKP